MEELLKKYIQENCTPQELRKVLDYISTPQGRRELEDLMMEDWDKFEPGPAVAGAADAWHRRLTERAEERQTRFSLKKYAWIGYAATLMLISGLALYFFGQGKGQQGLQTGQVAMIEKSNPKGKRSILILPDSSTIYLGAESRIRFPERFAGNRREISLEGEAFFEIRHNAQKPFIVHTGPVQTQVLGTSFKIEAFKNELLTVSVATGKVSVGQKEADGLRSLAILTPGNTVSWNPSDGRTFSSNIPVEDVSNLKNGTLAFTDARMDKIALDLGRWFNTKIIIGDANINAYELSITIDGKSSINGALDAITSATGLKYKIAKNQITITQR